MAFLDIDGSSALGAITTNIKDNLRKVVLERVVDQFSIRLNSLGDDFMLHNIDDLNKKLSNKL